MTTQENAVVSVGAVISGFLVFCFFSVVTWFVMSAISNHSVSLMRQSDMITLIVEYQGRMSERLHESRRKCSELERRVEDLEKSSMKEE